MPSPVLGQEPVDALHPLGTQMRNNKWPRKILTKMLWESREEMILVFPSSITIIHSFNKMYCVLSGNQSLCSVINTGGNIHSCSQDQHHKQRKHHKKVEMGLNLADCDFSESSFCRMVKADNRIKKGSWGCWRRIFFFPKTISGRGTEWGQQLGSPSCLYPGFHLLCGFHPQAGLCLLFTVSRLRWSERSTGSYCENLPGMGEGKQAESASLRCHPQPRPRIS